jgi:hypothetical protein
VSVARALLRAAFAALLCCAGLVLAAPAAAPAEPAQLAALAERIAKLHAQAAYGVLAQRSRRALAEALREFDATLRYAASRAPDGEARESYLLLAILWDEYRGWASRPPARDTVRKVADRADEVAHVAAKAARQLRLPAGPLAGLAARACVLSQRMPRLHLMLRAEPRNAELAREAAAAAEELRMALATLSATPQNSVEIAAEIQVADTQHGFLVAAAREMARAGAGATRPAEDLAKTGDHILESMQRVMRRYEALAL